MYNHVTNTYQCSICLAIQGIESPDTMIKQADIFYKDDLVAGIVNSKFVGNNPGHAIVVPIKHYEHIYDLPEAESCQVIKVAKAIALALKEIRHCDGIMMQQNNEPASGQHAFHYHLHIFPRFTNDRFNEGAPNVRVSNPEERLQYAKPLKDYFLAKGKV